MRMNLGIRRRLAPLLDNDRRRIELMNGMLMSLPGTPIIYYGDEIGMGDNVNLGDRNGVRTPMQWDGGWNGGFSTADPETLYSPLMLNPVYGFQAINVQSQKRFDHSLLSWMKRLIRDEKGDAGVRAGLDTNFCIRQTTSAGVRRKLGNETILVVNNLSSTAQAVELDLKAISRKHSGRDVRQEYVPANRRLPYLLTMGPYQFYWFKLRRTVSNAEVRIENVEFYQRVVLNVCIADVSTSNC